MHAALLVGEPDLDETGQDRAVQLAQYVEYGLQVGPKLSEA